MRGIATSLWNYPTVFAGAVQVANAQLAASHVLSPPVALGVAVGAAVVNFIAVTPARPR